MAVLLLVLGFWSAHLPARTLHAQEETPNPTIYEGPIGPYDAVIRVIPYPPTQGLLNIHAAVRDSETGQPAADVRVVVRTQRQDSASRDRATLRKSDTSPISYGTQLRLLEEGIWTFTFEVSGSLGEGSVDTELEVAEQPRSLAGLLAFAGLAVALLLVLFLAWRNANRMRRARAS